MGFEAENESRRLFAAGIIKMLAPTPEFMNDWDRTPEYVESKRRWKGSLGTIIGKRKNDKLRKKKTLQNLSIPHDQIGFKITPDKGYLFILPDGKRVYTLFFVRGVMIEILLRDKQCVNCGATDLLTRDHIMPISKGGSSRSNNLQILCLDCNREKRDKVPSGLTHQQRQKLYK